MVAYPQTAFKTTFCDEQIDVQCTFARYEPFSFVVDIVHHLATSALNVVAAAGGSRIGQWWLVFKRPRTFGLKIEFLVTCQRTYGA